MTTILRVPVARATFRVEPRTVLICIALIASTSLVFLVSLSVGDFPIPLSDVLATLFGGGSSDADFIVGQLRLPRAINAVLVGAAFGMAGALFQTFARNPLASPDIIGVNAGAAAAAVLLIVWFSASSDQVAVGALLGALGTSLLIYVLAYRKGVTGYRLVLVGIGMTAILTAMSQFLLTRAEITDAQRATVWLIGSLNGRGWDEVGPMALALVILGPAAVFLSRSLGTMLLGDDTAVGLGVSIQRSRISLLVIGVGLSGAAVATAGPVAFVALVSPQIARRLVRSPGPALVSSALAGALLLVLSDLVARRLFAPTELPVGVVTGVIGGPYLLWLLARATRIGSDG